MLKKRRKLICIAVIGIVRVGEVGGGGVGLQEESQLRLNGRRLLDVVCNG